MTPLRQLYVTARTPFGHDAPFVLDEIRALMRGGHTLRVVPMLPAGGIAHAGAREVLGATEARWPWSPHVLGAALLELLRAPRACLRALRLLLTAQPRHLLANLLIYPKALWLARRARALRIEHIHAHWATTPAALAMAAAEITGIPWSFTGHRYDLERNDLLARKARHAAFVRVISRSGEKLARTLGAPPARIARIHLGVEIPDLEPAPAPARRPGPPAPPVLLCPARFVAVKNHAALLRAFAQVTLPAELWLAGAGPLRSAIEAQIADLGLPNVRLLGALPQERVLELYRRRRVDAVVLASTIEGIPVALMEAMAAGVPVIATAVGGVPELAGIGAGMLVPPGDEARLTRAMVELLGDAALRARLGHAGRARVARRFTLERNVAALADCFAAHAQGAVGSRSAAGMPKHASDAYRRRYATARPSATSVSVVASPHQSSAGTTAPTSSGIA
jgi:colanic acid/amylovoran biosynthesis glycosyltransferase